MQRKIDKNNTAVAEETVPTPDVEGGSSDIFGSSSTDSTFIDGQIKNVLPDEVCF